MTWFPRPRGKRLGAALAGLAACVPAVMVGGAATASSSRLLGEGAYSPHVLIESWDSAVSKAQPPVSATYTFSGSTLGRGDFAAGSADYATTAIPLQPADNTTLQQRGDTAAYVPLGVTGLAIVYTTSDDGGGNKLPPGLQLSPSTLARIFTTDNTKKITQWNAQAIQDDNPGTTLPKGLEIKPVTQSDGDDQSYLLSDYLHTLDPGDWPAAPSEHLPAGTGTASAQGPYAVAYNMSDGFSGEAGMISYADVADLLSLPPERQSRLDFASLVTTGQLVTPGVDTRQWVRPTTGSVTKGLAASTVNSDNTVKPNYSPSDSGAYPLTTVSVGAVSTTKMDRSRGRQLAKLLRYGITDGQATSGTNNIEPIGYVPLSTDLVNRGRAAISQIPGANDPDPSSTTTSTTTAGTSTTTTASTTTTTASSSSSTTTTTGSAATTPTTGRGALASLFLSSGQTPGSAASAGAGGSPLASPAAASQAGDPPAAGSAAVGTGAAGTPQQHGAPLAASGAAHTSGGSTGSRSSGSHGVSPAVDPGDLAFTGSPVLATGGLGLLLALGGEAARRRRRRNPGSGRDRGDPPGSPPRP